MLWSKRLFKSCVIWVVRLPHQPPGASVMLNVPETISQNYQWAILQKFATRCQASLFWVCSIHTPLPSTRQTGSCPLSLFLPARLWEQMSSHPKSSMTAPVLVNLVKYCRLGDFYIKQLFPHSPGGIKLEIQVSIGLIPSEASLLRL